MLRNMARLIHPYGPAFLLSLAAGVALDAVMAVLNPLLLKHIFDEGIIKKDFSLFVTVTAGFMLLATAARLFNLWNGLYVQRLKNNVLRKLVGDMLGHYFRTPYDQVIKSSPGYYVSRIYDEPLAASSASISLSLSVCSSAVSFAVSLGVLVFLSWKATLALLLTVPFLMALSGKYRLGIKKHSEEEKEGEGKLRGVLGSVVEAYRTVNIFGLGPAAREKADFAFDRYASSLYSRVKDSSIHNQLAAILMSYGEMLVILVCGWAILKGDMTFGGFMGFMNAFWLAVGNMRSLVQKIPEISRNSVILRRLMEFDGAVPPESPRPAGGLVARFDGVNFGYNGEDLLSELSFSVGKGEKILLSGKNGCGKSTVANILSGFLRPGSGVAETAGSSRTSACVTPYCFIPGSMGDNLGYAGLDDERRRYLSGLLADFGLSAELRSSPGELSAGQRKKTEIIMGLMKEADLYIFDEPLANVDADSKKVIMSRIFERTEKKSLIVIMHGDEEYRENFDRVLQLA